MKLWASQGLSIQAAGGPGKGSGGGGALAAFATLASPICEMMISLYRVVALKI